MFCHVCAVVTQIFLIVFTGNLLNLFLLLNGVLSSAGIWHNPGIHRERMGKITKILIENNSQLVQDSILVPHFYMLRLWGLYALSCLDCFLLQGFLVSISSPKIPQLSNILCLFFSILPFKHWQYKSTMKCSQKAYHFLYSRCQVIVSLCYSVDKQTSINKLLPFTGRI